VLTESIFLIISRTLQRCQIDTFSQQWETQNTNLDDLENAVDRMTDICTRFGVLYQSVPRFEIMKDQLEFLRSKHFRRASIAKLLGISERTLRRRREELGLETDGFTEISENNLTAVVQSVKSLTPNIGQSRMLGALRSRGLHVQRWRVREKMRK